MADERDPAERVRKLVQFAGQVAVDNSIAPKKYFRSGVEMERMVSINSSVQVLLGKKGSKLVLMIVPIEIERFRTTNSTFTSSLSCSITYVCV